MKLFRVFLLLITSFTLISCASSRYSTKKNNYIKQSKTLHPIIVPADAIAPQQKPYYPVPNGSVNVTSNQAPSLKPPGLQ